MVNYTLQNYDTATEKLTFEWDKSFRGAPTNIHLQNPCMTSRIIFVTILYCTIYCLLYQEFLLYFPIRKVMWISHSTSYFLVQLFLMTLYRLLLSYPKCVRYFLMHQVLFIISDVILVSAVA